MTTLFNRLKNDILTSIQEDGGISGGMDEEQFEAMLDEAIFEETHVTVIIHVTSEVQEWIESEGGFLWDYHIDTETGDSTGTPITPNNDGDYVIEGVSFGAHIIHPTMDTENSDFTAEGALTENTLTINIDKDNYEFEMTQDGQPKVTTQQEI